jgi:hypothetical protein
VIGLVLVSVSLAVGQVDVTNVMPGTWEGQVSTSRDRDRTLVITAVRQDQAKWIAEARYGITGRTLRPVEIPVSVVGKDVILEFYTPGQGGGAHVVLKLDREQILRGSFQPKGVNRVYDMRLEKLAPK